MNWLVAMSSAFRPSWICFRWPWKIGVVMLMIRCTRSVWKSPIALSRPLLTIPWVSSCFAEK
jgi:hypothetical protein